MLAVAVEWEIYARTHSATALGLVGLAIAVPVVGFSFPAGHLADRFSRRSIIGDTNLQCDRVARVGARFMAAPGHPRRLADSAIEPFASDNSAVFERHHPAYHFDDGSVPLIYLLLFVNGISRSFGWAARASFFPTLVSRNDFSNAVTWNNSFFQIGSVVGPGIGGLLVAHIGFPFVY